MSSGKTMRRVVLPQAMRVIVPPTGNETIAMMKDTSLLIALPLTAEMFFQLQSIGSRTYRSFPVAGRRDALLPDPVQRLHGRPVLPRTSLRPWLRHLVQGQGRPSQARGRRRPRPERRPAMTPAPTPSRWCTPSTCTRPSTAPTSSRASTWTSPPARSSCLLGPSGSGKTTFLRCINQLETIDGGRIWVDGDLMGYAERDGKLLPADRQGDRRPAPRDRHGLPAVQPVPAQDRDRERDGGAGPGQGREQVRRPQAGRRAAGAGRHVGPLARLPGAAVRRPAAAGGDRPSAGHAAEADAVRRADQRARPRARRRGAERHARAGRTTA